MISSLLSRLVILVFGTLYPAYASYKAVKSKNVKEYVKWMMYWIVFALFTCAETLTDLFFSFWFPFYYEIKILIVIWLLCPATKGSSIMYRNFVHPWLSCREEEIDEYIARAKEQSYATVLQLGTKGINYASTVIMQTALKNLPSASAVIPSDSQMTRKNQSEPSVRRGLHFANDSTDSLAELQHDTKESASSPDAFTGTEKELTFIKTERLYDIDIESSDDSVDSDYSPEVAIPDFKEVTSEEGVQYDGPACNTRRRTRRGVH
ncbi:unnamed protein product [Bemisia tabaci]|uniref:Receptor expression-enhancing protein n=1 Tax=Bemisia tabaci TaxID=7038 RepID=A0A9P0AIG8_BEMTA|nr:unnamed protein product [Bemisia tabaci]